jgi:hypothetical protein
MITNNGSGRVLDLSSTTEGSEILFEQSHNGNSQRFLIEARNAGQDFSHVMFSNNAATNFVVDGAANFQNGSRLYTWERIGYGSAEQWFTLRATLRDNIGDDFYALVTASTGAILTRNENGATSWQTERRHSTQIMHFSRASDSSYRITNYESGNMVLDMTDIKQGAESKFHQSFDNRDSQRFWIEQRNNGDIMLSPKSSPLYVIDAAGHQGNFSSGSQVWTWSRHFSDNPAQWFTLKVIDNIDDYLNPKDDLYIRDVAFDNTHIEICNPTNRTISTKGLYLSNDTDDLFLFQIPSVIVRPNTYVFVKVNLEIAPDDYILKRMKTNFAVNTGDTLRLVSANGDILSEYMIE